MVPKSRYMLDFKLMPETMQNQAETFIKTCLAHKGEYMAHLFNSYFHNMCKDTSITYRPQDFNVSDNKMSGSDRILYIELPDQRYDSTVWCTAYAVAYSKSFFGAIRNVRFFTVEGSLFGTTCIGSMNAEGEHVNYGDAYPTRGANLNAIHRLYQKK